MKNLKRIEEGFINEYLHTIYFRIIFIVMCIALVSVVFAYSITLGGIDMTVSEVYHYLFEHIRGTHYEEETSEWLRDKLVWDIRLPRSLFAIVAGAGLAIAGAAMQSLMKNPLADPYTTGVASGACFGVSVSVALGISVMGAVSGFSTINAFVFALVPTIIVVFFAPKEKMSPATLILAGQAISYLFNALTTILLSTLDSVSLSSVYEWEVGTLKYITWDHIEVPFCVTVIGSVILMFLSRQLNVLALGDKEATALGVNVETLRILLLIVVAFMSASIIAYAGIIGFVGLVTPHIVRFIIGSDNKFLIPASAAFGALFLLTCDTICRIISDGDAMPVGIIVSFIGAPIFLALIIKQRRSMW